MRTESCSSLSEYKELNKKGIIFTDNIPLIFYLLVGCLDYILLVVIHSHCLKDINLKFSFV